MIAYYALVSAMPFIRHPFWSHFVGDLTMVKYLGAFSFAYALFYAATTGRIPSFLGSWTTRCFLLFALLGMASYGLMGLPQPFETSPLMSLVSFVVLMFVTLILVDSPGRLRTVLLVAVGSVTYASLHVIREWQKYGGMSFGYRPGWVTGDPNYFSVSALLCLPVAFYLLRTAPQRWERYLCVSSVATTLVALTLAASRGALLGVAAGALLVVWRSAHRTRTLFGVACILAPLMVLTPASPLDRLLNPTVPDQESWDIRKALWDAGLVMISNHPLTGIGTGNFKSLVTLFSAEVPDFVAHNSYVEIAAEMGVPGLFLFVATLVSAFVSLQPLARDTSSRKALIPETARGLQTGLLASAVALFFVSAQYQKLLWLLVFLSVSLRQLFDCGCNLPAVGRPPSRQPHLTRSRGSS